MPQRTLVSALCAGLLAITGCGGEAADGPATTTSVDPPQTTTTAPYRSEVYADPRHWLCRPDRSDDACDRDLSATIVAGDGSTELEPFAAADDPGIDCFYVYPTISDDPTPNSDLVANDSEAWAALNQAARFQEVCRLFAPVYRQITLAGLFGGGTISEESRELAYADVLDAWRHYRSNDNAGRGVVLIGHSQGASNLRRLIAEEIEPDVATRRQLVSALLLGSAVSVPAEATVGGSFQHVPMCTAADDTGCVISFATFSSTSPPPPDTRFGKPREGGGVAICTNPAELRGTSKLTTYLPTETARAQIDSDAVIDTPYVKFDEWAEASCRDANGVRWLEVSFPTGVDARPDGFANAPTDSWGLHLIDVSLAQGTLIDLVKTQAESFRR